MQMRYDRASDVLHVSLGAGAALVREGKPGLLWRYSVDTGTLIGVTIVDLTTYWKPRRAELVANFARRFGIPRDQARQMLEGATQ